MNLFPTGLHHQSSSDRIDWVDHGSSDDSNKLSKKESFEKAGFPGEDCLC